MRAVRLAGGPTRQADLAALNLAAPVEDGQRILVPQKAPRVAGAPASSAGPGGPVSLSSATVTELDALDGVGPMLAARIVAWREEHGGFSSVDELDAIPGIGPARFEQLRELVAP